MTLRLLALAIVAAPLCAQNIASFQVVADANKVVAGNRIRARAVARDPQGTAMNLSYRWSVTDANVASVDFDGNITGLNLGITRVRASVNNNVFAETTIQVIPGRIELSPDSATMEVGERRQFTARVLDATGKTLNTPLRWQVLSGQGFNSNAGSVTNTGMVTALAEGALLVRAGFAYNTYMPGLQNEAFATALLRVAAPAHYSLKRIVHPAAARGAAQRRLSFRNSFLSASDAGQILFTASFDERANGLVLWDGGRLRLLAAGGTSGVIAGTSIVDFYNYAINQRGDIVSTAQNSGAGQSLIGGRAGGLLPVVWDNVVVGAQYEGANNVRCSRSPIAADGGIAFQANFRNPGETQQFNGLFYHDADGNGRLVASTQEPLPALGGIPSFDVDGYGPVAGGTVYFLASGGGKRGLFRQRGFEKPEKVLLTGEAFLGATVNAFMGSNMFFTGGDDVVFGVQLSNNTNHLVRLPGGNLEAARTLRLNGWNSLFALHPEHGVLLHASEPGQPSAVMLWKDSTRQIIVPGRTQVEGATIDVVDSAAVDGAGTVTAMVRTAAAPMLLAQFEREAGAPSVLLRAGDAVDFALPDNLWGFVPGGKTSGPHVVMAGTGSSIFEVGTDGSLRTAFSAGEHITGVWRHTGSAVWNARRGNDGRLYVTQTTGYGVARKTSGGAPEQALASNRRGADGVLLYNAYEVRVNASGQMLTTQGSDRGDTRLTLTTNGETQLVAATSGITTIEGFGTLASWNEQQLDDAGRVFAIVRNTQGQAALGLWSNGSWRVVMQVGQDLGRWRVSNVFNLKSVGNRFYFRGQVQGGFAVVAEVTTEAPRIVLDVDDTGANGTQMNVVGVYDVNSRGDIFYQSFSFGLTVYGVKRADGSFRHIYTNTSLTAEGDLPLRLLDADLRDDGTVYLIFVSLLDEPALYKADPR